MRLLLQIRKICNSEQCRLIKQTIRVVRNDHLPPASPSYLLIPRIRSPCPIGQPNVQCRNPVTPDETSHRRPLPDVHIAHYQLRWSPLIPNRTQAADWAGCPPGRRCYETVDSVL